MQAERTLPSGFEALGHPVPAYRKQAAYEAMQDMVPSWTTEEKLDAVDKCAFWIERDEPYTAQAVVFDAGTKIARHPSSPVPPLGEPAKRRLDYTGALRLFCTLLTAEYR